VNILFAFTAEGLGRAGGNPSLFASNLVSRMNTTMIENGSAVRFNMAGIHTGYPSYPTIEKAFQGMLNNATLFYDRNRSFSDIVLLFGVYAEGFCGDAGEIRSPAERAFAVINLRCDIDFNLVALHEVGHLMGGRHQAFHDTNSSPHPKGHGYVTRSELDRSPATNPRLWARCARTIMSSPQTLIGCNEYVWAPVWSNPRREFGDRVMVGSDGVGRIVGKAYWGEPFGADMQSLLAAEGNRLQNFRNTKLPERWFIPILEWLGLLE
jgi:hypothetical protein